MSLSARHSAWRKRVAGRWSARLYSLHHAHFKIVRGIGWTLLFVIIARLAGAGREMALAAQYGVGEVVDAYLFVFTLLSWPFTVWFGVLRMVLIPAVIRLRREKDGVLALQQFRAGLLGVSIIAGISFAILFWLLFSTGAILPYLGFSGSTAALVRGMAVWLIPILPFGFIASFYSAWVMASGRYVNTLIEAVPPLVIMLAILLIPTGNAASLISGTLLGIVLQVLVLAFVLSRVGEITPPMFAGRGPEWRQFWKNFCLMVMGNALLSATVIADQMMAASLAPGTIATLGYANRIIALMLSLGALTANRAILPIFSDMHAAADPRLPRMAMQWMILLFLGGATAAIAAWWFAPPLIGLLFERGAFTTDNTRAVAEVFSFALVQIPFVCAGMALNMQLAASGRYGIMALIGASAFLIKVVMNWLLIPPLGAAGIALATGIMYASLVVVRFAFVKR